MDNYIKSNPLKHGLIFITYFILASLLLFNRQGGADIAFIMLISLCFLIHFISLVIMTVIDYRADDEQSGERVQEGVLTIFALIIVVFFFIILSSEYLEFMWWVTSKLK